LALSHPTAEASQRQSLRQRLRFGRGEGAAGAKARRSPSISQVRPAYRRCDEEAPWPSRLVPGLPVPAPATSRIARGSTSWRTTGSPPRRWPTPPRRSATRAGRAIGRSPVWPSMRRRRTTNARSACSSPAGRDDELLRCDLLIAMAEARRCGGNPQYRETVGTAVELAPPAARGLANRMTTALSAGKRTWLSCVMPL